MLNDFFVALHTNAAQIFLWRALVIFLLIGALSGVVVSLLLILKPALMERINGVANRWISMRPVSRLLDHSVSTEHWFYKHHRVMGMFIILGSGYILFYFGLLFDKPAALQHLARQIPAMLLGGLLDGLVFVFLFMATVALIAGFFICLRPSCLRSTEKEANLWLSTRRATRVLDVQHDQVDPFVARHARQVGALLLLGSVYLLFSLFRILS